MMGAQPVIRDCTAGLPHGIHSRGQGRCSTCARRKLRTCGVCGQPTLHDVGIFSAYREEVCENGCTRLERCLVRWRAEMAEALYQLERRES